MISKQDLSCRSKSSAAEAAWRIKADRIDILVELKGYTKGARTGIAAQRPAPVQVSFIGFPGTMGGGFIDYVIADPFVLPIDQQAFYSEKIVHLPHCYQPNDTHRLISNSRQRAPDAASRNKGSSFARSTTPTRSRRSFQHLDASLDRDPRSRALALGRERSRHGQSSWRSRRARRRSKPSRVRAEAAVPGASRPPQAGRSLSCPTTRIRRQAMPYGRASRS